RAGRHALAAGLVGTRWCWLLAAHQCHSEPAACATHSEASHRLMGNQSRSQLARNLASLSWSLLKSLQVGFMLLTNAIFLLRPHAFICFSRSIAPRALSVHS